MKYGELIKALERLTEKQKQQTVLIHDKAIDEFIPLETIEISIVQDVVDMGQIVLGINN